MATFGAARRWRSDPVKLGHFTQVGNRDCGLQRGDEARQSLRCFASKQSPRCLTAAGAR